MAQNTLAICSGPIEFTDPDTGEMTVVPVGALTYDTTGTLVIASPYTAPPALGDWLHYLAQAGQVRPAAAAPPPPAMTVSAASPGAQGNNVQISISITTKNADPTLAVFKVTVTETDTYANLTLATIKNILGSTSKPGARPGLVHLLDADTPTTPAVMTTATALAGGTGAKAALLPIPGDPSGTAFTLEAKAKGADGGLVKVAIPTVDKTDPAKPVFTLTATWTKPITGVTIATIAAQMADLGYVVSVSPPSAGVYSLPSDNGGAVYQLSGGVDGSSPSTASAVIPSGV